MATSEEHKNLADQIKSRLKQFLIVDINSLMREVELGNQLSFKKGEPIFINIIDLFKRVNTVDLSKVPFTILSAFQVQLEHAINVFGQISVFDPNTSNPVNLRDSLIAQLEQQLDLYYTTSLPILTIGLIETNDLSVERAKINETLNEFKKDSEEAKNESSKLIIETQEVLQKARQAAVEVGVAQHYLVFKQEAEDHKLLSEIWLKRTVFTLVGIGIVGVALLFIPIKVDDTHYLIQFTISKIVVLSVLFYGLTICTRNYKAHKHNSILNKHRQNALNTFETFTKAAGTDIQTKNAVLLEATHTIFSNQQTGYLNSDNESDSPNKIIEIFKSNTSSNQ